MKTFNQLSLEDKLFVIDKTKAFNRQVDSYGNLTHDGVIHRTLDIKSIEFIDNFIYFNRRSSTYSSTNNYDLRIIKDESTFSEIQTKTGEIFFTDEIERNTILRKMTIEKINELELNITSYKEECLRKIRQIRENYYTILNNVL